MDETIYELEKMLNKKALDMKDQKLIIHTLICVYNTLLEIDKRTK